MIHYMLYVSPQTRGQGELPWNGDLTNRGVVVLRAAALDDIAHYCRSHTLLLVLVDLTGAAVEEMIDFARRVRNLLQETQPHAILLGLAAENVSHELRRRLADAGMRDLVSREDPEEFLFWRLELFTRLAELEQFEQSRFDVARLAHETRERLHELSQPLSAVQGRLQLIALRASPEDPNYQHLQDMVRMMFEVSQSIMSIHQIHRRYS
ncbi:MAG: hypothetical protein M1457_09770 [bacterium]|nr:hypothetical protein [bacterium]